MDKSPNLLDISLDQALGAWYKARLAHDLTDRVTERYFPTTQQSLNKKFLELDIIQKKRMLGIPLTDDDYEKAVNQDRPFIQRNLGMMSILGVASLAGALPKVEPLPNLKSFEKPKVMNYVGKQSSVEGLPGILKYFGESTKKPNVNVGELYGWIRRGVFRR